MKLTAEITHDQIQALVAHAIKVDPADLDLSTDENGAVACNVTTDSKGLRKIERTLARVTAQPSQETDVE